MRRNPKPRHQERGKVPRHQERGVPRLHQQEWRAPRNQERRVTRNQEVPRLREGRKVPGHREKEVFRNEGINHKLYMCIESDEKCSWRVLDMHTNELLEDESSEMSNSPVKIPLKNGSVVLGTKIYVIGGSSCQIFDTATQRWALGEKLDKKMNYPLIVPIPNINKLFVFAGIKESFRARAYDIKRNKWSRIENPKKPITKNLTGHFFFRGMLVLWNEDVFCTFHIEKRKWKDQIKVKDYFPGEKFCRIVPRALSIKNCWLLWFSGKELMSYNLTEDETFHFFLDPQEAKHLSQCFQSVTNSFLVSFSDEKLCLIWLNNELDGSETFHWCTFTISPVRNDHDGPGQGPFRLQIDNLPENGYSSLDNARILHCLTMHQPNEVNGKDLSSSYDTFGGRCLRAVLRDLSRTMYLRNFLSISLNMEHKGDPAANHVQGYYPEVEISIDSLMKGLGLGENCRRILDQIIDKEALQLLTEDELKKLNISVDQDSD